MCGLDVVATSYPATYKQSMRLLCLRQKVKNQILQTYLADLLPVASIGGDNDFILANLLYYYKVSVNKIH